MRSLGYGESSLPVSISARVCEAVVDARSSYTNSAEYVEAALMVAAMNS